MKKFLLFSLLLLSGCQASPKFHYHDCVLTYDPFYGTQAGIVADYYPGHILVHDKYRIFNGTPKTLYDEDEIIAEMVDKFCK